MAKEFDYRDLLLSATADVTRLMGEVMQEMTAAEANEQMLMIWHSLPAEMKEKFKKDRPEEYKLLMDQLQGE